MRKIVSIGVILYLVISVNLIHAGLPTSKGPVRVLSKSAVQDFFWYAPNRIGTYISNEGELVSFRKTGNAGMEWPVGSGNTINFQSGIWIGGMVGTQIRTAAAEYTVEFTPGTYEDWKNGDDRKYKIYTITRNDVIDKPGDDYLNWPFEDGAPMLLDKKGRIVLDDDGNMIPGLIGSQLSWSVFNDADITAHANLWSTSPLGLEVQQTMWSFNRADVFGDMMFMKYLIINKGGNLIEDTYLSFWADIDLGAAADDLVGADTVLSLGYNYNDGADNIYGAAPPAIGYDFFQGPIVESPGDTAKLSKAIRIYFAGIDTVTGDSIFNGGRIGFRNLPMTSLAVYENGGPAGSGDPQVPQEMYFFQQGLDGLGAVKIDPTTDLATKFSYPGDPVKGEGWIRSDAGDLRFMLSTGPFTLAPGDTQELVGGIIIAQGTDPLNSITKLKVADRAAQIAYDLDFSLAAAPPAPNVTVGSFPGEIVLTWKPNSEVYHEIDKVVPHPVTFKDTFYDFQGYNIYQANGPISGAEQKLELLATYDVIDSLGDIKDLVTIGKDEVIITVQEADNSGIQRFINITTDRFTGLPLVNYRKYYFIVESYGINPFGVPKLLSTRRPVTAVPGPPVAGTVLNYDAGEVVNDFKNEGIADIDFKLTIVDANQTLDRTYEVSFFTDSLNSDYWWMMTDALTGEVLLDSQGIQKTSPENADSLLIDPLQINIVDAISLSLGGTYLPSVDVIMGDSTFQNINMDTTTNLNFLGTSTREGVNKKTTGLVSQLGRPSDSLGGDLFKVYRRDIELRITDTPKKASLYNSFVDLFIFPEKAILVDVDFELWDVEYDNGDEAEPGRPINAIFLDDWEDETLFNGFLGAANGKEDMIIAVYSEYDGALHLSTDDMAAWVLFFGQDTSLLDQPIRNAKGDTVRYKTPGKSVGDRYRFSINNHIVPGEDVITFSTFAPSTEVENARLAEVIKINVFPNPYLGQNLEEINLHNRFVTFTHLPPKNTTIRIFTLAGHLVTSIKHDNGTPMEKWDLNNARNIPVASGMYIAHIEVEGGASKILKLAIFMPEERLDLF